MEQKRVYKVVLTGGKFCFFLPANNFIVIPSMCYRNLTRFRLFVALTITLHADTSVAYQRCENID